MMHRSFDIHGAMVVAVMHRMLVVHSHVLTMTHHIQGADRGGGQYRSGMIDWCCSI